jgi:hypothetical protein
MRRLVRLTTAGSIAFAALIMAPGARAGDLVGLRADDLRYEFFEPYLERIDTVTTSAGNARDINAVTHMIDPWPRNVRNRRIPANGERMAVAVGRYRQDRLPALPPIQPTYPTSEKESAIKNPQFEIEPRSQPQGVPLQSATGGAGGR